jgi:hypothetical protein
LECGVKKYLLQWLPPEEEGKGKRRLKEDREGVTELKEKCNLMRKELHQ